MSWKTLWDPKYRNKYSVSSDQYEANVYIAALSLGYSADEIFQLEKISGPKLQARLNELAKNAASLWEGVDRVEELKGLPIATSWGDSLGKLNSLGENWKFANPKEGTTGWLDILAINSMVQKQSKLKKIALEWLDFALSETFQIEAIVKGIGNDPVNRRLTKKLSRELVLKHHLNDPNYFKNNRILWKTLDTRTQNGFKLMWNRALKNAGKYN